MTAASLYFMLLSFLVFYLTSDAISTQSCVLTSYEVPNIYNLCLQNRVSNCQVKRSLKCGFSLLISRFAVRDIVCLAFPVRLVVTDLAMYMDFLSSPGFGLLCKCKMSDETDKQENYIFRKQLNDKQWSKFHNKHLTVHSVETTLLRVKNDILLKMNWQRVTLLVLLDLGAAFDTVDHGILLDRLLVFQGMFTLGSHHIYMIDFSLSINGGTSRRFEVKYGVPQGSCLGPLLFALYASKLFTIIERHLPDAHARCPCVRRRHTIVCVL